MSWQNYGYVWAYNLVLMEAEVSSQASVDSDMDAHGSRYSNPKYSENTYKYTGKIKGLPHGGEIAGKNRKWC